MEGQGSATIKYHSQEEEEISSKHEKSIAEKSTA